MFYIYNARNAITHNFKISRNFWQWLNFVFNSVDKDRRKLLGPDRTCAEWLLRNGASVKWTTDDKFLSDYNALPPEKTQLFIKEVDATESSVSHYGFSHFVGCNFIEKIIFHNCSYLENQALPLLHPLSDSLTFLQITSCANIDEKGLNSLNYLKNLNTLVIGNLPYLNDKEKVLSFLKSTK